MCRRLYIFDVCLPKETAILRFPILYDAKNDSKYSDVAPCNNAMDRRSKRIERKLDVYGMKDHAY